MMSLQLCALDAPGSVPFLFLSFPRDVRLSLFVLMGGCVERTRFDGLDKTLGIFRPLTKLFEEAEIPLAARDDRCVPHSQGDQSRALTPATTYASTKMAPSGSALDAP